MLALGTLAANAALAATAPLGGVDILPVLASLAVILVAARLGGALAERLKLPAVLGELAAGIVLGNLDHVGFHAFDALRGVPTVEAFAQVGVLFLLFQVGLESDVGKMAAVGLSATLVAVLGVITPMVLGFGVSFAFLHGQNPLVHWFVGATLTATSVGITARVLGDLQRTTSVEGRIILGAAVIDDVLGLIVLAVVSGLIVAANAGRAFDATGLAWIVAKALG
ncbi:MAG TPA: cation:proton antiporter, partial [Methylomirabilota bacterium]|nr:cation:proton antiporter [Methylomirabilota bacterium]